MTIVRTLPVEGLGNITEDDMYGLAAFNQPLGVDDVFEMMQGNEPAEVSDDDVDEDHLVPRLPLSAMVNFIAKINIIKDKISETDGKFEKDEITKQLWMGISFPMSHCTMSCAMLGHRQQKPASFVVSQ